MEPITFISEKYRNFVAPKHMEQNEHLEPTPSLDRSIVVNFVDRVVTSSGIEMYKTPVRGKTAILFDTQKDGDSKMMGKK